MSELETTQTSEATPVMPAAAIPTEATESIATHDEVVQEVDAGEVVGESTPEQTEETPTEEEYAIEWGDFTVSDEFSQIATGVAKETGLDKKAVGEYTSKVIQAMQESVVKAMEKDDAALKEEWGSEYNSKVNACRTFIKQHAESTGLAEDDVNVLFSPKGYKLVESFMKLTGESEAQVGKTDTNEKTWAQEVQNNPNHPDYKSFHDRTDPRYEELSRRWYRAHGMKV